MIQRIQTVFLLLVAALGVALFFLPVFTVTIDSTPPAEATFTIQNIKFATFTAAISAAIALITIFLYKKRQRQMMLGRLNLLFIIGTIGLVLAASDESSFANPGQHATIHYTFAVYLPLIQIVFDWLAIRFIKKDDDLVRSADRLR